MVRDQQCPLGARLPCPQRRARPYRGEVWHLSERRQTAPGGEDAETQRYLKAYTVFSAVQIEGIGYPQPENLPDVSLTAKTIRILI